MVREVSIATRDEGGQLLKYWPWPHFKIQVAGPPDYHVKLPLKFIGAVEELEFETTLLGKYGSQPSTRASSFLSGLDTGSRHYLKPVPEVFSSERGR